MCFFTDIDPIGESDLDSNCGYCGNPCDGYFCNDDCRMADYKESCCDDE